MGSPAALRKHLEKGNVSGFQTGLRLGLLTGSAQHTKVNMKVLETTKGGRTSKERLDEAKSIVL